jgi:hypothetical protein
MGWWMWLIYLGFTLVSAGISFLVVAQIVNYFTLTPDLFVDRGTGSGSSFRMVKAEDAYKKAVRGWTTMIIGGGIILLVIFFFPWKPGLVCRLLLLLSWLAGGAKALEHYFWMRTHGER